MSYDAGKVVGGPDWVRLNRNENHFIPSEWFERTLKAGQILNCSQYPDPLSSALRERLARIYQVDLANIYVGNGSDGVLGDLFAVLRKRYHTINLPDVGYKVYDILAERLNFSVNRYESGLNRPDIRSLHGLSVFDSPNAITGSTISYNAMQNIVADPDNFVIWDNCYGDFEDRKLRIAKNLTQMAVVRSFSKYYGLAGLRIGYCVASSDIVSALDRWKDIYNVNIVAQSLALRALDCHNEFEMCAIRMLRTRKTLQSRLTSLGFTVAQPHANFLFATHPRIPAAEIEARLEARKIAVRRFVYPEISNWLRITIPSETDLERVSGAIETATELDNHVMLSGSA